MSTPKFGNLQELIDSVPSLVDYFYHDTLAPHASNRSGLSPVPMESSNWRDEQRAWRETVLMFDQSHHMPESFLRGKDSTRLLSDLGFHSFVNFQPMCAHLYLGCNHDGIVNGQC